MTHAGPSPCRGDTPANDLARFARCDHLLPGEDRECWPQGLVALWARGARIAVHDVRTGRRRVLYDLISGYGAFNFGHAPAPIQRAMGRALRTLDGAVALPSPDAGRLAARLLRIAGFTNGRCYFTVGGSQAVEIALRIGRLLSGRPEVAVVTSGFHGYGAETVRLSRDFVPPATLARLGRASAVRYLPWNQPGALELLERRSPRVGVLLIEPVLGAGGFLVPDAAWIVDLLTCAQRRGIVTVVDEIQVGMGRTGRVLAIEHFLPAAHRRSALIDAVVMSKSLSGGQYPLSAIVLNGKRHADLASLNARASLGETFSNNPGGCAAALAALDLLDRRSGRAGGRGEGETLLASVRRHGRALLGALRRAIDPLATPGVRARGIGLALAIDMPDKAGAHRLVRACFDEGLLCYVGGGKTRAVVKLIPPLTITRRERDAIASRLQRALARQDRAD